MRIEAFPGDEDTPAGGVRITLEKHNPVRDVSTLEEHDFTLAEAELILQGLPSVIEKAKEHAAIRRQYERRNLIKELERLG